LGTRPRRAAWSVSTSRSRQGTSLASARLCAAERGNRMT